jgi:hypothetical protein
MTYNYYRSIAETTLNLHFGSPYSTGTVDWGYTRLVLLEHLRETPTLNQHLVPIRDFC